MASIELQHQPSAMIFTIVSHFYDYFSKIENLNDIFEYKYICT